MLESPCKHRKWHSFDSFVFCACSLNDRFEWCSCYKWATAHAADPAIQTGDGQSGMSVRFFDLLSLLGVICIIVSSWFCSGSPICISVFTTVRRSWLNMTAGRCLVHTTYASIEQDSSARGGHFVPRRAAETASGKPLKAKQNHGKPWQDSSLKRKSKGSVGHASETGKPQQDSSPNLPKPSPVKLSNVAF